MFRYARKGGHINLITGESMKILMLIAKRNVSGGTYVRGHLIQEALQKKKHTLTIVNTAEVNPALFATPVGSRYYDMIIIQNIAYPNIHYLLDTAKEKKIPIVYDFDDDLFNIPDYNEAYKAYKDPLIYEMISYTLSKCSYVTVTTDWLKWSLVKRFKEFPEDRCFVLPNCFNPETWSVYQTSRQKFYKEEKDNQIIIGYTCSESHTQDFAIIAKDIVQILKDYHNVYMKFIGVPMHKIKEFNLKKILSPITHKIVPCYPTLPQDIGRELINVDIGIAPLAHNDFNRARSNNKWIEYSIMGIPTIASDIEPYKACKNIRLVEAGDSWWANIRRVIDKHIRDFWDEEDKKETESFWNKQGDDARKEVYKKFDINNQINYYIRKYEEIINNVRL
jgi:hypothetical protein